jgi:putative membrane protein
MGMWCQMSPASWLVMGASWLAVIALVVWGVARMFPARRRSSPRAALDEWLASGDIDTDLYRRLRADMDAAASNGSSRPW